VNILENKMQIKALKSGDRKELTEVTGLIREMYAEMSSQGLMMPLAERGAELWVESIAKTLGRVSYLLVASSAGQVRGFAHGALRFLPDYLGGHLTGNITHIFVAPEERGSGMAAELLRSLEEWFISKKVHSIDLQVIPDNEGARKFWAKAGYPVELIQHRKIIS
jgi:ribosomal protein S18 acetylase RimI-like enzyme